MIASLEMEKSYSKEQILEMYLNSNFYGSNCYGIQAACKYYFGCDASDVTISQAAMLIGISNAPTKYNPETNYELAICKRNQVLNTMYNQKIITEKQYNEALEDPLDLILNTFLILQKMSKIILINIIKYTLSTKKKY